MWIEETHGHIGEVKTTRGNFREYLGIKLYYSQAESIKIDMVDYVKTLVESFPSKYFGVAKVSRPFNQRLFTFMSKVSDSVRITRNCSIQ